MMEEFTVKVASKPTGKKCSVFSMHKQDQVSWTEVKMRRENEYQPWQIKLGSGRTARRFKAIKEGGIMENASYFVFYKSSESSKTIEACPIDEWYSVSATQRYKTLTAEEAEQKYEQIHKTLNMFSVMQSKRNGDMDDEGDSAGNSKKFKISEMDDWDHSGDNSDFTGSDNEEKKSRKKKVKNEKEDPDDAPDEGKEDSDEGDFEQREVDYMSDTSSSSSDLDVKKEEDDVKGIAEEEALRDLLSTDDEEDAEGQSPQKTIKVSKKKSVITTDLNSDQNAGESDESSDSDDYDVDEDKMDSLFMKKSLPAQLIKQEPNVEGTNSVPVRRNAPTENPPTTESASAAFAASSSASSTTTTTTPSLSMHNTSASSRSTYIASGRGDSQERLLEDLLIKYLRRKPISLKDLLSSIKNKLKRTDGPVAKQILRGNLPQAIAPIITRMNPTKQKINDLTYFSLPGE